MPDSTSPLPGSTGDPDLVAPTFEVALWRCFELTGADTSDGPYPCWQNDAMLAVEELREERDKLAEMLDDVAALLDKQARQIREAT